MTRGVRQLLDDSPAAAAGVLDEGAKREIRRATLTAVCVPGYQVPFGSLPSNVMARVDVPYGAEVL